MHFIQARDIGRRHGEKRLEREPSERESDQAPGKTKHDVLGEHLSRETTGPSPDRGANGHLSSTRGGTRQLQVRDIDARDEHHADHRTKQQPQRRPRPAREVVQHRRDGNRLEPIHGILLLELRGDGAHIGPRLLDGHIRLELSDDEVVVATAIRVDGNQRGRHPDIGRSGIGERRWSDANDLRGLSDSFDRLANRSRSFTELAARPRVAHDSERRPLFGLSPHPATEWLDTEDVEEVGRHELNGREDRRAVRHDPDFSSCVKGHVLEHVVSFAPVAKIGRRRDDVRLTRVRPERLDRHDPIR